MELIAGYQNVICFGWTNAFYVAMKHLLNDHQARTASPERRAFGQSRRKQVRRQEQNRWRSADRQTDPIDALAVSAVGRVPALLAIKWERMAASPFGFFRGAVPVMAADLAVLPHTGIFTQLCGDAHVRNLGAYAAPDGRLVFDINDFDETIRGPFEWDLKRLATSIMLAGREAGSKSAACAAAAALLLKNYRRSMHAFARMPVLDVARFQVHRLQRIAPVSQVLRKAERATPQYNAERLLQHPKKNAARTASSSKTSRCSTACRPPRRAPFSIRSACTAKLCCRSANTFSISTARSMSLFGWWEPAASGCAITSSIWRATAATILFSCRSRRSLDPRMPRIWGRWGAATPGPPRCAGPAAMQFLSDLLLGWTTINNRQYLVRQLNDHKGSIEIEDLKGEGLMQYAEICGELLARGHARSGDAVALDGYIGTSDRFVDAIADFAVDYADQTEADYKMFLHSRFAPRTARKKAPAKARRPRRTERDQGSGPRAELRTAGPSTKLHSGRDDKGVRFVSEDSRLLRKVR